MKTKLLPLIAAASVFAAAPTMAHDDIVGTGTTAYVLDKDGDIVRDRWDRCVRTIDWTKETAIAKCEGWPEPKAEVKPEPKPVVAPKPVVKKPEPKPLPPAPVAYRGHFAFDSAMIKATEVPELDAFADYMNQVKDSRISIVGHTDSKGPKAYNQKLSEKRANAVKSYLEGKGIAADRMEVSGMGETQPLVKNNTRANRAENRRVEVEIIK